MTIKLKKHRGIHEDCTNLARIIEVKIFAFVQQALIQNEEDCKAIETNLEQLQEKLNPKKKELDQFSKYPKSVLENIDRLLRRIPCGTLTPSVQ